jgi:hypothetical protein
MESRQVGGNCANCASKRPIGGKVRPGLLLGCKHSLRPVGLTALHNGTNIYVTSPDSDRERFRDLTNS